MPAPPSDEIALVLGASGFLGGLVAAALLRAEHREVILPVRDAARPTMRARLVRLLREDGVTTAEAGDLANRASIIRLPPFDRFTELIDDLSRAPVGEVVHCAGSVDYFDESVLREANIRLTGQLIEAARAWGVRRFIYLSTAYSGGYCSDLIREQLHAHPSPSGEPNAYTRTKRVAEWMVADSGVPFLIVRPSVVIGDSRDGRYGGKNYGLYQMWRAIEGLLCREYAPIWYTVAPPTPVNLVHQDAFQAGFLEMYRNLPESAIAHLVGDGRGPTMQDLCMLWADVYCPIEIHSYDRIEDVPLRELPRRQRRFLELAWKNIEIASWTWRFETRHLERLRAAGLRFADASLESVARCQQRYIEKSPQILEHMRRYGPARDGQTRLIERTPLDTRAPTAGQ